MARLQIERNDDLDETLPGGRNTVHRWTLVLSPDDLKALSRGEALKVSEKLPDLTVKHLYLDVTVT